MPQASYRSSRLIFSVIAMLPALFLNAACSTAADDLATWESEVMDWRETRRALLLSPTGFLSLAGLFWLENEVATFGSAPDNDLVFPEAADAYLGTFTVTADGVVMNPRADAEVYADEWPVGETLLADDTTDSPVMITHGSLGWTVIKRDDRYAVRLRDFEHPALKSFPGLEYFPIDPAWRIEGTLRRYDVPRQVSVGTVIEDLGWYPESPGVVEFRIDGELFTLEAYASGERLFFVFGDRTNARETYPAGRFLYTPVPGEDGRVVLDFNRAYSPPCAFNDFATCPVASPRNRLPIRIPAGERFNPDAYTGTSAIH